MLLVGSISLPGRCLNVKVKVDAWLICKSSYYVREHVCFLSLCLHTSTFIYTCLHLHLFISGLLYCLFFDTHAHIHTALMFTCLYIRIMLLSLSLSHTHTLTHTHVHTYIYIHTVDCMHVHNRACTMCHFISYFQLSRMYIRTHKHAIIFVGVSSCTW